MTTRPFARRSLSWSASLLLGAALTVTAGPAQAVTFTHDDAVGDVIGVEVFGATPEQTQTPRPNDERADITQLRVRHGKSRVIMRIEVVDMTRRSSFYVSPTFAIKTPTARFTVDVTTVSVGRSNFRNVTLFDRRSRELRCDGIFSDFDFTGEVALVSVPRQCIGSPRSVRIGATMTHALASASTILVDDALRDGEFRDRFALSQPIVSGPRRR